jgi:broad specificity phosphatase PhoE
VWTYLADVIYLIRHGQTESNAQQLLVGRRDVLLTELGERQAAALAPLMSDVVQAWVSPLARARATASLALGHLVAQPRPSFIEVDYGHLEGRSLRDISNDEWRTLSAEHDKPFGGGESLAAVDRRVHRELDQLLGDRSSLIHDPNRHLGIVSHVSPIKSALAWALGVDGSLAWRTRVDNGSLTVIGARHGAPLLVRFNVVPSLGASV